MQPLTEITRRVLTRATHRIRTLPVVVLMPHSACNCRCVMCDIWKANAEKREISHDQLAPHVEDLRRLHTRRIVLSGGEALMHSNLWELCRLLHEAGMSITLLSTGLLLERHAASVVRWCNEVIVSLDGSQGIHDQIRNVPRAYQQLARGVDSLRDVSPALRVAARCVVQRENFRDVDGVVEAAHELRLDTISFVAADVSTEAFNRPLAWDAERSAQVALSPAEARELAGTIERLIKERREDFESGFIVETPDRMRSLARYFLALNGDGDFPPRGCNAPWVSTVIEADGTVRPCFFHRSLGNLHEQPLESILNSQDAVDFRRNLDVGADPICRKCVCRLKLSPWAEVVDSK